MRLVLATVALATALPTAIQAQPDSLSSEIRNASSHPEVARYLEYFQGPARERMQAWLQRGERYRGGIRRQLSREGLPSEFEFLPMIESGYSTTARSRAGAVGLWQFIPETAREYGLRVDRTIDERRDPSLATEAAIRHLGDLKRTFGSSLLAAAAFNGGAGRVRRGLDQLTRATGSTSFDGDDFFELAGRGLLARETREYVPQLVAASMIGKDPAKFGFSVAKDSTRIEAPDLPRLSPAELRPIGIRRPSLGLLIRVRRGDSLEALASRYRVRVADLRRINALPPSHRLRPGQALRLPGT
jgi:membrane-bound lytic murein transglycosylase D